MAERIYTVAIPKNAKEQSELIPGYGKSPIELELNQSQYSELLANKGFSAPVVVIKVDEKSSVSDITAEAVKSQLDALNSELSAKITTVDGKAKKNITDIAGLRTDVDAL